MEPTAKRLTLDLLSTLQNGSAMPVGALIEAGELFGISANNMRVSVARLLAGGHITRDERGRYRVADRLKPIGQRVRSWRDLERKTKKWAGGWIGVHAAAAERTERQARQRALRLLGFRRLRPAFWLRPDNLAQSVQELRAELTSLGLPAGDLVFTMSDLDATGAARAHRLWDVEGLRRTYQALHAEIEASMARLESLPAAEAMAESYLLGGRALRQLVFDPLLPEEMSPSAERTAVLVSMRLYDRLGRLAWADLLKRFGVPYLRAPLDAQMDAARTRVAV